MSGYEKSAHLYDLFDQKENAGFFGRYATLGEEVLDVGAGTGRIAILLAERGVRVVCVEPSPAMREQLRLKLTERPELDETQRMLAETGFYSSGVLRLRFHAVPGGRRAIGRGSCAVYSIEVALHGLQQSGSQ